MTAPLFQVAGLSRTGRRAGNEDSAVWGTFEAGCLRAFAIVCDGMGGHNAGEVASALAVEHLERRVRELAAAEGTPEEALPAMVREFIAEANREIHEAGQAVPEQHGMGTTLALAFVTATQRLLVANIGDSRIFLVRGPTVEQISVDHTALAEQRRALGFDLASPEDLSGSPFAHALTRSLGQEPNVDADVRFDLELQEGDLAILTSDGVTDVLEAESFLAIVESVDSLEDATEEIYRRAFEAGSRDNITVALCANGRPTRLGAGPSSPQEAQTISATVPLWRSASGGVQRLLPPHVPSRAVAAEPPVLRSRLASLALGLVLPLAALGLAFVVYLRGAVNPAAAPPPNGLPMPLTAPVAVARAVLVGAEIVPVGQSWSLRLRFEQRVLSQSTDLTLDAEGAAPVRLPCDGFGSRIVTCALAPDQVPAPVPGHDMPLKGRLGDGLDIDTAASVKVR